MKDVFFEGVCSLELEVERGAIAKHKATRISLAISDNLNNDKYFDQNGVPNTSGSIALTNIFVQGLIANIHSADSKGYWSKEKHLEYIVTEIKRGLEQEGDIADEKAVRIK